MRDLFDLYNVRQLRNHMSQSCELLSQKLSIMSAASWILRWILRERFIPRYKFYFPWNYICFEHIESCQVCWGFLKFLHTLIRVLLIVGVHPEVIFWKQFVLGAVSSPDRDFSILHLFFTFSMWILEFCNIHFIVTEEFFNQTRNFGKVCNISPDGE